MLTSCRNGRLSSGASPSLIIFLTCSIIGLYSPFVFITTRGLLWSFICLATRTSISSWMLPNPPGSTMNASDNSCMFLSLSPKFSVTMQLCFLIATCSNIFGIISVISSLCSAKFFDTSPINPKWLPP